jgi:hypothetical protein
MKAPCRSRAVWVVTVALFLAAAPLYGQTSLPDSRRPQQERWRTLHYAVYFTSHDIETLLDDSLARHRTMAYFAPVRAEHVYLECSSSGDVNVPLLRRVADALHAMGYAVSGALVPTIPGGPLCYNNPDHLALLERRARALAQVFDEFIIDDWLFTTCTCEKCVAERGKESWADYRCKLLLRQSRKYIIEPAKAVRPGIRIIIKYPNWYEGHRDNGYDVYGETRQFDAMAIGIETRTRWTHDQHIPIYSGYVFQKWWPGVDPSKWVGSWLDNYGMKGQDNDYVAQVWQAVLAQSPEIILWCAGQLYPTGPSSDVFPHFREMLPQFDRAATDLQGAARGVPIYLPYGSTGEYNIFAYFGMAGIPLQPVGAFPESSHTAIFTEHSLRDPDLARKMLDRLRNGHDVFMTWSLFKHLQNTEFKNTLNVMEAEGTVTSSTFRTRVGWNDQVFASDRPFKFPAIQTTTWPYARDLALVREDNEFGILLDVKYLNGRIVVLNMPENSYDLLRLPTRALDMIRNVFTKELGVQLSGPGGVALYLYGQKQFALYNMNDEPARISLLLDSALPVEGWTELLHGKLPEVEVRKPENRGTIPQSTLVSLTVQPFELTLLQAP